MRTIEIHFSIDQLIEWITPFFSIICKKISEVSLAKAEPVARREYDLNYMKVVILLIQRENFMYAWLCSETLYQDLEYLYHMHLPSPQEFDKLFPVVYHELVPGLEHNKHSYQSGLNVILQNIRLQQ